MPHEGFCRSNLVIRSSSTGLHTEESNFTSNLYEEYVLTLSLVLVLYVLRISYGGILTFVRERLVGLPALAHGTDASTFGPLGIFISGLVHGGSWRPQPLRNQLHYGR